MHQSSEPNGRRSTPARWHNWTGDETCAPAQWRSPRSVEVVEADLTSAEGLSAALAGVDSVVVTANPTAPRPATR